MQTLAVIIKAVLFLLLLAFAVANRELVSVHFLLDWSWQAPLALLLLIAFAAGLIFGLLAATGRLLRYRRELGRLRKAVSDRGD